MRSRGVSRNTVRKALRAQETTFSYERILAVYPTLGPHLARVEGLLEENAGKTKRERLTLMRLFEQLRAEGYAGSYDAVRRYAKTWQQRRGSTVSDAYVPLVFAPGEAYQFDWSHEIVVIDGVTTTAKVAHLRLSHSRIAYVRAYPWESQEIVFDAHNRAFAFFRGACSCGINDNMKTAVEAVFVGKARAFNRRFEQLMGHYLIEPTACTPGAGWEKGQVESQVGAFRHRLFTPGLRFKTFEDERETLIPYRTAFDGYRNQLATVSKTCLVRFDHNRYSVQARAVGRPVGVYAYADTLVIRQDGEIVGRHPRRFGRRQTVYDPWHYVPVLSRKPGALRNGAPFKDWVLPGSLGQV